MSGPDDKSDREDSFASRWSRRKQQVAKEHQDVDVDVDVMDMPEAPTVPLGTIVPDGSVGRMQTRTEADRLAEEQSANDEQAIALTDEDMPQVETLDDSSDFSGFMSPGVSEKLRRLALRKLFTGAGFNIRDGLDDYDDDFTNFAPLGDIVTCDMKHRMEMEAAKKEQEEEERLALEREEQERLAAESGEKLDEEDEAVEEEAASETESDSERTVGDADDDEPDERVGSADHEAKTDLLDDPQASGKS